MARDATSDVAPAAHDEKVVGEVKVDSGEKEERRPSVAGGGDQGIINEIKNPLTVSLSLAPS